MPTTITGTDGVSQVQTGAVEAGDLPAGSVLQVKYEIANESRLTTSSTSYVDTGANISITPMFSNSLIIVEFTFSADTQDFSAIIFTLFKGSTELFGNRFGSDGGGNRIHATAGRWLGNATIEYAEFPGSTSEQKYDLYFKVDGNGSAAIRYGKTPAFMRAMEIKQ